MIKQGKYSWAAIIHPVHAPSRELSIYRGDFKVLLLVYKSLNNLRPKYISDLLQECKPNRALRSLGSSQLVEPRVRTKQDEAVFS